MNIFVQNICAHLLFPNVKFLAWSYMLKGIYSYILHRHCQIASLKGDINIHWSIPQISIIIKITIESPLSPQGSDLFLKNFCGFSFKTASDNDPLFSHFFTELSKKTPKK